MKTLIINGSPRKTGDTAFLLAKLKEHINHEIVEFPVYKSNIQPCIDCKACKVDDMIKI